MTETTTCPYKQYSKSVNYGGTKERAGHTRGTNTTCGKQLAWAFWGESERSNGVEKKREFVMTDKWLLWPEVGTLETIVEISRDVAFGVR